jgi:hypothetical protein
MANKLETIIVDSTAIEFAEYNNEDKYLTLYFKNEGVYRYLNVPHFYWRGLAESTSKGKFINNFIVKKFNFTKFN